MLGLTDVRALTVTLPTFEHDELLEKYYFVHRLDVKCFGVVLIPNPDQPQQNVPVRLYELLHFSEWASKSWQYGEESQVGRLVAKRTC